MSTAYYYLREPFTSIRLERGPSHDRVTLWERGANIGTLTVSAGTGSMVTYLFAEVEYDGKAPMRTHWGGTKVGCVVTENVRGLDPSLVLVSEYGDVLTVGDIRARSGHGRGTAKPGELFGYENDAAKGGSDGAE